MDFFSVYEYRQNFQILKYSDIIIFTKTLKIYCSKAHVKFQEQNLHY